MMTILAVLFVSGTMAGLYALTGTEIMTMVDEREDGTDRQSEMEMTLTNHRGVSRVREMRSYGKDYGEDSKQVMVFLFPADVAGTGYLSWEYDDPSKDDDRWLYMPALRSSRRISGSSSNDYFMGSDFTYDDMGDRNIDEDTHTLLREENLDGNLCWVVESVPVDPDDMYDRKVIWVRQDNAVVVKVEYYDAMGLMKVFTAEDIRQVNGIWTAHRIHMDNIRDEHQTTLTFSSVSYDQGLDDNIFTVAAMERGRIQ
ncbi:outer membrane lipoprotein-sorting protein [Candidatus Fermentibacteria bacterium]|nr:MAG: outer membrane lipoprotein-sorting protein [Candidatus Fermentibacteria bacterium]PIE53710.1 MAG: outer membrane lipoprotein-sorting protein [Candidatus Fermentibacteria bacterium]